MMIWDAISRITVIWKNGPEQGVLMLEHGPDCAGASGEFPSEASDGSSLPMLQFGILNEQDRPIVFLLWGRPAQMKKSMLTNPKHLILEAPHPSPLSAYRGFFGCKTFQQDK